MSLLLIKQGMVRNKELQVGVGSICALHFDRNYLFLVTQLDNKLIGSRSPSFELR